MMTERLQEYYRRWPEPMQWRDYEYDGPLSDDDQERLDFVLTLSEKEQRVILLNEGNSKEAVDRLFSKDE